jgi:shikimate kinase
VESAARIYLIGLPGSGKTTVGRQLARRLSLPFTDSDLVIEQRVGCQIRDFFEREGEAAFRDVEQSIIEELVQKESSVIATGGGAVLRAANRERLRQAGHVIYLYSTPKEIFKRLRPDGQRPLLQVADSLTRLYALYEERDPLYRETSHLIIETGHSSVAKLVSAIIAQLEFSGAIPRP